MLRTACVLLLSLFPVAASFADSAIPDTPPGRLLRAWLESFNAGDLGRHTRFQAEHVAPEFMKKKDSLRDLKDFLQFFVGKPLRFEPGKGWSYSNAGMIVAGLIVERVSGQRYFDYVREHIYKPTGMVDSDSFEKTKPQPNQSVGYLFDDGKWISNVASLPLMGSSAGGGDSTAPDLLRFAQALRDGKLVRPDLATLITTGKADARPGERYAYGFIDTQVNGERVTGHGGGAPGMNANLDIYWDSRTVVVVLANRDPPIADRVNRYIRERIKTR